MPAPFHRAILIATALALIAPAGGVRAKPLAGCSDACGNEAEPTLTAPTLVQPALLSGPNFRVVPEVEMRGYMAHFLIDTPYGPLTADSVDLLGVRVSEIPALEALDRASKTDAFAHALAERGRKTGAAVVNVFAHPIDTVIGLPAGVVRYLRKQLDTWGGRAQSLADQTARHAENRGDPYRAPEGPMTAARDVPVGEVPRDGTKNRAWYARAGSEASRETKRYLKYSQQRREMAKVLGVDPNSTNPILNEMLDSLAWAAVAGNFSAGAALGQIAGTPATVISESGRINQYVLEVEPEQLRETLDRRLHKLCSDDASIRSFLRRGGFSDTLRVALIDRLEQLQPQQGCNELVELAATTRGEVEARYLVDALMLIAQRVPSGSQGTLLVLGAAVAWRGDDEHLLLPLPVDYLTWSHDLGAFFDQPTFAVTDKSVLIGGEASITAQREIAARGWNQVTRASYAGAPAYAAGSFAPGTAGAP